MSWLCIWTGTIRVTLRSWKLRPWWSLLAIHMHMAGIWYWFIIAIRILRTSSCRKSACCCMGSSCWSLSLIKGRAWKIVCSLVNALALWLGLNYCHRLHGEEMGWLAVEVWKPLSWWLRLRFGICQRVFSLCVWANSAWSLAHRAVLLDLSWSRLPIWARGEAFILLLFGVEGVAGQHQRHNVVFSGPLVGRSSLILLAKVAISFSFSRLVSEPFLLLACWRVGRCLSAWGSGVLFMSSWLGEAEGLRAPLVCF